MRHLFYLAIVLLTACQGDTVYKEYSRNFTDNRWMADDIRSYKFAIAKNGRYDVIVDFSHVYDTPLNRVPLSLKITGEGKTLADRQIDLLLKDENGKMLGDCMGDYCDLRVVADSGRTFGKGSYEVKLRHRFDFDYLPNVLGVGIRVEKSR